MTRVPGALLAPLLVALTIAIAPFGALAQDDSRTRTLGDPDVAPFYDEDDCLDNRQIQDAINAGIILPLADVLAGSGVSQRPLSVKVCNVQGTPHYVVNTIDSYGESERIVLNAEAGYE